MSDREHQYSKLTGSVLGLYAWARAFLVLWLLVIFVYTAYYGGVLINQGQGKFWPPSIGDISRGIYWLFLANVQLLSRTLPLFVMVAYTALSLKALRSFSVASWKSILVFWFVLGCNFAYVLPRNPKIISFELDQPDTIDKPRSILVVLLIAVPFVILRIATRRHRKTSTRGDEGHPAGRLYGVPYEIYVAAMAAIVAALFDLNITVSDQTVGYGIVFGFTLAFIIASRDDLQRILLFLIAPQGSQLAHDEIVATRELEEHRVVSEMLSKKSETVSERLLVQARAARQEAVNKIRGVLSASGETYVKTKEKQLTARIEQLTGQLEAGTIDMDTYEKGMDSVWSDLDLTYKQMTKRVIKAIPGSPRNGTAKNDGESS